MKNKPEKMPAITLPWLVIIVLSMVMFLAFLIAMFYGFYANIFFALWMWALAISFFLYGFQSFKENKFKSIATLIMGVIAVSAGVYMIVS